MEESKEEIWEKQQIITTKEKQNLMETKKKQYIHEFNWLTAAKKGIEVISQLNQQILFTPSRTEAYQLKRKEKLNSGSTDAFQQNNKETNRLENAVFSPPFRVTIQQACTTSNYEKIRSMFHIFRYSKTPKLTSEFTRRTRIMKADYQQFNPHTDDSLSDYNFNFFNSRIDDVANYNFFDFRIAEYTPDYSLSDSYADFDYVPYGKIIDSKRVQDWKKHNLIQIDRMKNRLGHHLFFKPTKITAHRLKWAKAISFNYEKNTSQKARFAAAFLTHSLIPVPAENGFSHKIHNKFFRKTGQVSLSDKDFLFYEGALAKRSSIETTYLTNSNELLEPSSSVFNLLFNLYSLKRKPGISKEAVKSILRRKHSSVDWSKLKILIKQALIERKAEQGHGESPALRRIRNMSLIPSVQFLIQNFLEKTALLLDYESLTDLEKPGMGQDLTHQQKKVAFPYFDKKNKKTLSTGRRLSAKKAITGKNIPVKFSKDLLIFQRVFLKETIPGFPVPYTQHLTSKPAIQIRNILSPVFRSNIFTKDFRSSLFSKGLRSNIFTKDFRSSLFSKGLQSSASFEPQPLHQLIKPLIGVFGQVSFQKGYDHAVTWGFRSSLFSKGLRLSLFTKDLLIRNPLLSSNNNIFRADISKYGAAGPSGNYKINRSMSREISMRDEISMYNRISERRFFAGLTNIFHKYPETISKARPGIFEKTFVPSIVETNKNLQSVLKLSSYQNQGSKISENTVIHIFNFLTNLAHNQLTGFQQNEKQFQPDILKTTSRVRTASPLNWQQTPESESAFLTSGYDMGIKPASRQLFSRFKIHRPLLARNKPGHTTRTFGKDETYMTGSQTNPVQERKFNSRFAWIQKIFDFSKFPLPFIRTTIKGENPADPQKISVLRGSSLRESDSIVTYTPEQPLIQLLSLNRARIFRNHVVLKPNSTKRRVFNSSTVHTKLNGQKVSHWKTARMNLSPEGGKQRSADTGNFPQRKSLDSMERKNNRLRVNKNIDIPEEAQMRQRLFSDSILSYKYDFTKGMKQKKITSTTYKPEKKPEKMQDTFNGFLFRSKTPRASILKSSEKAASSRIHLGPESTDFVFSRSGEAGKPSEFMAFGPSVKGRSELKYPKGSNRKTEREDLVYGISEPLLEEVKKIKKIIFETREIVADHLESHMPQATGKPEQVMDIEDLSEKIMQAINHRLKIEAERRGIF
ncbi:MAG TPA: hypothetical protein VN414_08025 [Methanosarcina sp.]|nr:hypothetical protein [Methanosarcina sp.]